VLSGHLEKILRGCIGMGRQISNHHKRCIREEDCESKHRVIDEVQKCLSL
jgi:hypothetical protein